MSRKILITGTAGFIGFHLAEALLALGNDVVGIDNINDYYDVNLKFARLNESGIDKEAAIEWYKEVQSRKHDKYRFVRMNIEDKEQLVSLCEKESFDLIIHLAAQAGVRYSIQNPDVYIQSNIVGFLNILEVARRFPVQRLIYASSSSVYGMNTKIPFSVEDRVDNPVSLYAATKKSNELMAHTYSHLYQIKTTGLRFFTVYGPWGRPDMAYFLFADAIASGKPIKVFNHGHLERDFTYIDDIIEGILNIVNASIALESANEDEGCYEVMNLGNNKPVTLGNFICEIEKSMNKVAIKEFIDMQPGDVMATWADIELISKKYGYLPKTKIDSGMGKFIDWYKSEKNPLR